MSLTTERLKRVGVVVSNVTNLCALINVADEQDFLQKCMSPEAFKECMAGDTNMTRVEILCEKTVQEITAGNMDLFNALCAYFLDRSEAYKCVYQRFTAIGSSNSANGGSSLNTVHSELFSLQEQVKELTEELQELRESNTTTDYQSELIAVREILTENGTTNLSDESLSVKAANVVANEAMEVEKLEPTVVAEQPLLMAAQLSPCTIDNKPCLKAESVTSDTDVKPNVKEEIQTADDVSGEFTALTGDDKENDNVDVLNVPEADANNETTNQNRGYQCEYCGKKFRKKSHFEEHVRTHTGEKPFACNECDRRFSQNSGLQRHCRTHTGEKPFGCKICKKTFLRNEDLVRHRRTHTGEKPFACKECDKRFSESSNLLKHVRTHTGEKPFACKECDKRYSQSSGLLQHCRTHTGEKPFACQYCEKRFSVKENLRRHVRNHTGDRPFVCEHCRKAFPVSSGLRQHKLKKHSHATLKKR